MHHTLRVHLLARLTLSSQKSIDQVPRCVYPKQEEKSDENERESWDDAEAKNWHIYTLGSSSTLCGNGRAQLRQLFLACSLRFSGAIKAVLHLGPAEGTVIRVIIIPHITNDRQLTIAPL